MKVIDLRFWKARKDIEANEPVELYDLRRKGADDEAARKKLTDYLVVSQFEKLFSGIMEQSHPGGRHDRP